MGRVLPLIFNAKISLFVYAIKRAILGFPDKSRNFLQLFITCSFVTISPSVVMAKPDPVDVMRLKSVYHSTILLVSGCNQAVRNIVFSERGGETALELAYFFWVNFLLQHLVL